MTYSNRHHFSLTSDGASATVCNRIECQNICYRSNQYKLLLSNIFFEYLFLLIHSLIYVAVKLIHLFSFFYILKLEIYFLDMVNQQLLIRQLLIFDTFLVTSEGCLEL